jgi:hypothetical protein
VKSRLSWRKLRRHLGLAGLVTAMLAIPAAPASASFIPLRVLTETFEGSSASTWTFDGSPGCSFCGFVDSNSVEAHGGTKYAFIEAFSFDDFFSVGKSVPIPRSFVSSCVAHLYVMLVGSANIEVIDPSSWTYLGLHSVQGTSSNYQLQSVSWTGGPSEVYFRVSVVPNSAQSDPWAQIDDITIDCT